MTKARIMVVEDEQIVALDIEIMLKDLGYTVCARASTGEQAIKEALRARPDLVLMDIKLRGEIDGIQAAEKIKQELDVPVVYVTAYTDEPTLQRARITAPHGYIAKPIDIKELWASIDGAIYKHHLDNRVAESEKRFRSLIENSPDGVLVTNEEGAIIEWNRAAERITGLPRNDVVGCFIWDIQEYLAPQDQKNPEISGQIQHLFQRLFQDGQAEWLQELREQEIQRADGRRLTIQVVGFLMPASQGTMFASIIRDISAQKAAVEALSASQKRLQTVLSSAPVVLWALDQQGVFTLSAGKSLVEIGLQEEQVVGLSVYEYFKDDPQTLSDVRRALAGETLTVIHEVGQVVFETRLDPTRDPQGEVTGLIGVSVNISERQRAEEELQYLATHDHLTKIPNRALFQDRLAHALEVAKRNDTNVAVMFLDLDGFKAVNDTVGHEEGDQVLRRAAQRLKHGIRESDTIARLGGDEFGVVLEGLNSEADVAAVAQKILASISQPYVVNGYQFEIGASIGICVCQGGCLSPQVMLRYADAAMYRVKRENKGGYAFCRSKNI